MVAYCTYVPTDYSYRLQTTDSTVQYSTVQVKVRTLRSLVGYLQSLQPKSILTKIVVASLACSAATPPLFTNHLTRRQKDNVCNCISRLGRQPVGGNKHDNSFRLRACPSLRLSSVSKVQFAIKLFVW